MVTRLLSARLALFAIALGVAACGLVVGFDEYDKDGRRVVGGLVEGLEGQMVTLLLNGQQATVVGNGAFAFPSGARQGTSYNVTVEAEPPRHACTVVAGMGNISRVDVTDVIVRCLSTDATLSSLSLSNATLSPTFDPARSGDYRASPVLAMVVAGAAPSTLITAVTRSASARISIAGVPLASGVPSPPIPLGKEPGALDVLVTAASGAQAHTVVQTTVRPSFYFKPSNTFLGTNFGASVAVDGDTLAVGAGGERSKAAGVNGDQTDRSLDNAGAVYVFTRRGGTWSQQAYIKPLNPQANAFFGGRAIALAGDTLVVGAFGEASGATGIGGNANDSSAPFSGAVYVFTRTAGVWTQQAYIKASHSRAGLTFGNSLAYRGDTLAVGATGDNSNAKGVGGDPNDMSMVGAGAVYVFERAAGSWSQKAYVKPSNTQTLMSFGFSLALSDEWLSIGAPGESSAANVVDGNESDTSAANAGAVYVFARSGASWAQRTYVKPSNARAGMSFGSAVASSGDTLVVSAASESSGINGDQTDMSAVGAGAAYVFVRAAGAWTQKAYLKASNTRGAARFGTALGIDGDVIAVGAPGDASGARGVNGDQTQTTIINAGAAYLFRRANGIWSQTEYLKASNTAAQGEFGHSLAIKGPALVVGGLDSSAATGVNGDDGDTSATGTGAGYLF